MLVPELLQKIFQKLKETSVAKSAVSEQFGVIRTLQMVSEYRNVLFPPGSN